MSTASRGGRRRAGLGLLACMLLCSIGFAGQAIANPLPILTAPGPHEFSNDPFTLGFEFTVNHDSEWATALGWWDIFGDGLIAAHDVGLWSIDGTLLGQVTVPAGGGVLIGEYRYVALDTPVLLAVGESYVLAGTTASNESTFRFDNPATAGIMHPNYDVGDGRFVESASLVFPSDSLSSQMWTNANMLVGADPSAGTGPPIPEPGTAVLLGAGLLILARRRRTPSV